MTKQGGIIRNKRGMEEAIGEIGRYRENLSQCKLTSISEAETFNMAQVSLMVLEAALKRKESIGAHYREN